MIYSKIFTNKGVIMRKLLLGCVLSLVAVSANAEKGETITEIQQIVDFKDLKKDAIYAASRQWIATRFKSANNVIQLDDKENGVLIGKGNIDYPCKGTAWQCGGYTDTLINFTVKIEAKDEKSRVTFSDLVHHNPKVIIGGKPYDTTIEQLGKYDHLKEVRDKFNSIFADYKQEVLKVNNDSKDW